MKYIRLTFFSLRLVSLWLIIFNLTLLLFGTTPALAVDGTSLDPSNNLYAARQLGLGGLSIGFADDANGVFANPAGLTDFEFPQISGSSRTLLLGEVQSTLLTWAMPTEQGTFGVGFTSLNTGGSYPTKLDPATSRIIIDPSREATSYDNSVLAISYSRKLRDSLAIGGNLKFFNQALSGDTSSKASATGVDLALLYAPNPIWSFGANLQNVLEGNLKWEGGAADKIGGFYKIGAKVNILGPAEEALREHEQELAAGFDYNLAHNTTASSNYQFGLEYFPLKKIALRSGLGPKGLSFGVGLTNGGFRFDYAYSQDQNIPGDAPHYFTLSYVGERVKKIHYQLKHYKSLAKFIYPPDRTITDEPMIAISAEAMVGEVFEEKQIWEVTGLAATEESKEIVRAKNASTVYLNGDKLNQTGSIKTSIQLGWQRNVLQLISYSSFEGEMIVASAETRVLRYKPFADVLSSHWALRPMVMSETLQLVNGYPDNTFKPEKGISRAELVTLLVRTMSIETVDLLTFANFSDVPETHWANKYIAYSVEKGLVTGYPDGTFKPNKTLTRAEGITIFARYANLSSEAEATNALPFVDLVENFWGNKYIIAADKAGLLKYLENKQFEPTKNFTRAEACAVLIETPQVEQKIDHYWETGETKIISSEVR